MKILVLGAGALGGYYGGRLLEAGADVTFLVRPARAERLARTGLAIKSAFGDWTGTPPLLVAGAAMPGFDVILLTCKAYDLSTAIESIARAVTPATLIVPLLNGLAHLDALDLRFGRPRVAGGIAHIGATLAPEGEILHLNRFHKLTQGPRDPGQTATCRQLHEALSASRMDAVLSQDIMQAMWDKFVFLSPLAAMTCLMRANIGTIVGTRDGAALMAEALDEAGRVAAAAGHPTPPAVLAEARRIMTEPGSIQSASMQRDILRGGPVEAEHVVGDMLRRGAALGVAMPLFRTAYAHLQAYEAGRAAAQ